MLKLVVKNFWQNKKTSLLFLLSIVIASMLIFLIILLFSAGHRYILKQVIKNNGDYHVKIQTDLKNYEDFSVINKIKWQDNEVLITYNNIYEVYTLTDKLCQKTECANIIYNDVYLSLYGISENDNLLNTLKYLIIIILSIILISSAFIIYNIYKIFLITKYRQIALLQNIGMTLCDLRKMLLIEAILFSFLGVIIGFILSAFLNFILLLVLNHLMEISMSFTLNIKFLFYAFLFLGTLILIICFLPFFKSRKINNVKLLNQNYYYKKSRKFKNIIVLLSYLNYKRSKSHYKSVIISLVVFIVLTTTFNMLLRYGDEIINNYVQIPNYDAQITILDSSDVAYELLETFAKKNATKYKIYKTCQTEVNIDKENYIKDGSTNINLYIIEGNNYFINQATTVITENNKIYIEDTSYFKDVISLNLNGHDFNLIARDEIPFGYKNILTKHNLLIGITNINEVCDPNLTLFMNSGTDDLEDQLSKLLDKQFDLYYVNAKEGKILMTNIISSVKAFLNSILVLVFLIGLTTIMSASFLSMMYRKKEIGLLACLGFTSNNFKDIILLESLYITSKALLWSFMIVLFINVVINKIINEVIDLNSVNIVKPFLLVVLISMLMVRIVMQLCEKKLQASRLLDLIYNDNI